MLGKCCTTELDPYPLVFKLLFYGSPWSLRRSEEAVGFPGTVVTDGCESSSAKARSALNC